MAEQINTGVSSGYAERFRAWLREADRFQQRHRSLAVVVAVFRKFSDDRSMNLAGMIAFWAFFSVFPLLLIFVTLLGLFVPPNLKDLVLTRVARLLPLLDVNTVHGLGGAWWAFALGVGTAVYSGLFVVLVLQFAFNSIWELPYTQRPGLVAQVLRGVALLVIVGTGLVVTTVVTGYVAGAEVGWLGVLSGYLLSVTVDVGLFVVAFRLLTHVKVTTRDVLPGALLSGVLFFGLQSVSSLIISHYLPGVQTFYGQFAVVITMLWWFFLQSIVTLLGAQLNVVLTQRLLPRSAAGGLETEADRRAYKAYAQERTFLPEQHVDTDFPARESDREPEG